MRERQSCYVYLKKREDHVSKCLRIRFMCKDVHVVFKVAHVIFKKMFYLYIFVCVYVCVLACVCEGEKIQYMPRQTNMFTYASAIYKII